MKASPGDFRRTPLKKAAPRVADPPEHRQLERGPPQVQSSDRAQ